MKRHFMRIFESAEIDVPLVGFIDLSFNVHGGGKLAGSPTSSSS